MTHHVIIIDGTQSRLSKGHETNAGLLYKLLSEAVDKKETVIWYDEGVQGKGFWKFLVMASGMGINHSIRDAYANYPAVIAKAIRFISSGIVAAPMPCAPWRG